MDYNSVAKQMVELEGKERTYTPNEVAKIFDFSMSHVYRMIDKGQIKANLISDSSNRAKRYEIPQSSIDEFRKIHRFKETPRSIKVIQGKPVRIDDISKYITSRIHPTPPKFLDADEREVWLNGWRTAQKEIINTLCN